MIAPLENLLRTVIGLDLQSIGRGTLDRAIDVRAAASGLDRISYLQRVQGSSEELQELIELVVVPETWFFRGPEAFAALVALAMGKRDAADRPLRVLSVPCSTGEEPYSVAIALLDAGFAADRFVVDAVDISRRNLAVAEAGRFGANSFRSQYAAVSRHFHPVRNGHAVVDNVRRQVRFRHGNLLADGFLVSEGPYDAIFCRNLLIYFDGESQKRALGTLHRLLASDGLLFVGPADGFSALMFGFEPVRVAGGTAYRRPGARKTVQAQPPARPVHARRPRTAQAQARPPRSRAPQPGAPVLSPSPQVPTLAAARALADEGRLAEADAACRAWLAAEGASADGYCLLGIIADASGDAGAAEVAYRKAAYLDPAHAEALSHLALIAAGSGHTRRANVLAARGRRAEAGAPPITGGAR
jgi:chemotaxis protein methyltransferase WspC